MKGNIVLSRRVLLEKERETLKKDTLQKLKEGAVLTGIVKNLTDYGAFIDLGGIDGLLHITDMSWGRVGHPSEMLNVGDELRVIVLKFDPATERVSLASSRSRRTPGRTPRRSTRLARASPARWSASPTTAPSSRWSQASRAWCTSAR